jgi:acetyl/propionyl-CoA carboxylase alpha subunit
MGVSTSIPFHQRVMSSTNYIGGVFDTSFVEEKVEMEQGGSEEAQQVAAITAALITHDLRQHALTIPRAESNGRGGWRQTGWRRS